MFFIRNLTKNWCNHLNRWSAWAFHAIPFSFHLRRKQVKIAMERRYSPLKMASCYMTIATSQTVLLLIQLNKTCSRTFLYIFYTYKLGDTKMVYRLGLNVYVTSAAKLKYCSYFCFFIVLLNGSQIYHIFFPDILIVLWLLESFFFINSSVNYLCAFRCLHHTHTHTFSWL